MFITVLDNNNKECLINLDKITSISAIGDRTLIDCNGTLYKSNRDYDEIYDNLIEEGLLI